MADQPRSADAAPARGRPDRRPRAALAGWRVTPAPDGRGAPHRPGAPPSRRPPVALVDRCGRRRPAGAQPVDLLAGAEAQRAGPDPLQPDLPDPGQGRQRQGRSPPPATRSRGRSRPRSAIRPTTERDADDQLLHPGPVVRQQPAAVEPAADRTTSRSTPSNPSTGPSLLESLIFGFGPTLLLVASVRVHRPPRRGRRRRRRADVVRALAGAAGGGLRPARHLRGRGRHRRGQGGADRDRRLPQERRTSTSSSARGSPAACCSAARRAPARRCWPARSPARRACRSSRCRPRSSSR